MQKFVYNMFDEITPPVIVLSTKYHKHLGTIQNAINIACDFNMASHQEISFDVYKTLDDIACDLWDDIIDLKYIYVPDHNEYYEIQVTMDDADSTVKHCVGISAGECELSQRYLRDFHCNDDTDINFEPIYKVKNGQAVKVNANGVVDFAYDMYETDKLDGQDELYKATVFYRKVNSTDSTALKKKKRRSSLLYRVLHDKCPDWSVGHIDSTLVNIQRTFSTDATTVYDFLTNTIATEIGCLFKFDSVNRKINVYDLKNTCEDCGFRGEYVDKCPKCGSKKFIRGYGTYKNVNISTDNTALQMSVDGDADSVKNCFRITGGDDLMTATVRNINPNKSSYIYRFSDDMKADMPEELVEKLNAYETDYNDKIQDYNNKTKLWMEKVDEVLRLQTTMMPKTPIPDETNAKAQVDAIMAIERIDVALEKIDASSTPTQSMADNAVKGYLRVIVDPRYTVDVSGGIMSNTRRSWQGYITVKSLGGVDENGNEDVYTSTTKKTVHFNTNYEDFLEQKIQKSLDRTDASFTTIFNIEDDTAFKEALHLYSLDRLNSFANSYQAILEVLIKQGVTKEYTELYGADLYNQMYVPYYNRKQWINNEITGNNGGEGRENQVKQAEEERDALDKQRQAIQKELNIETYLGDLYNTFLLYLREDNYNNSNYISDGLNNKELVDRANELFIAAQSDLIKASELQYSLTGNLFNFLNTEEFANFKDEFEIGDYIICKADNKIYRLRITNVSYSYDNSAEIQITFSNIVRGGNFMSDVASVLSKASSMATSFNFVAHQANQGDNANNVINDYKNNGFDTDVYNLYAGSNQDISMDSHGLTAREYDDIEGDYKQEQVILTSHSLAFTEDNWETASLGLGRQTYTYWDEDNNQWVTAVGYGLNAKFVDAGYIRGSKIVAGDIYSNNYTANGATGAHIDLDEGTFTFANGKLKFDGTNLYIQGDVNTSSRIEDATIVDSTINTNDNFIVNQYGNVVLNGDVSGTAWATKQDKLGINPAGSATATIYKLQIDGDIYDLAGGSTVVPNPTGTATAILTKLGIDDVVYEIQGGSEYLELTQAEYDALTPEQKMNGIIYFITDAEGGSDATYRELSRAEYNALSESEKNNNTIYFVQDTFEVEVPPEGMLLGDYMRIQNSKLDPNHHWDTEGEMVKFFFNSDDCSYCYNVYKNWEYDSNAGMHPYYNHGTNYASDARNVLITQDMPLDTHYMGVYHSIYGLECINIIFIPKSVIDNGQAAMFSQYFYTSVECEIKYCNVWNDWTDISRYTISSKTIQPGYYHLNNDDARIMEYGLLTNSWFANYPIIGGEYIATQGLTQEEIDTYLATKEDNYPRYYNVNYFTFDHVMLPNIVGTEYFNSIDYTGRIEVVANPSGTATANLNKIKIDGVIYDIPNGATAADTTYDNTDSGLTATNVQDAIDEILGKVDDISVIEGLSDVNITTPADGDALIYDATNQEWVNGSAGGGTTVVPNPQGAPTDTLTTIQIGNDIYEIEGNGNEELIYRLQQGARWETFANPNSLYPLIVKAFGGSGAVTEVEVDVDDLPSRDGGDYYITVCTLPNAQGQSVNMATANDGATICVSTNSVFDTSTMGVNVYKRGSGGSSSVIPNPQGIPTDTLNTVEIDGVIYDIEGGGSSGSGGIKRDNLWSGTISAVNETGSLSKDLSEYDYLLMYYQPTDMDEWHTILEDCSELLDDLNGASGEAIFSWEYYDTRYMRLKFSNETDFICIQKEGNVKLSKVVGIKLGGIGSGYNSTLIWDYTNDNSGTIPYGTYSVTLNDNVNNYDMLVIENVSYSGDLSGDWRSTNLWYVDVNALNNNLNPNYITYTSWNERATKFHIDGTTFEAVKTNEAASNGLVRVYGIKYGGGGGGTDVEANPQDTPTDTLETIKIGDTVYDIAGTGGGGLGGECKIDTLYQAANSGGASLNTPITYNNGKHLSDYDLCYVYLTVTASGDATLFESHSFCPKDQPRPVFRVTGYGNRFTNVEMTDTDFTVTAETGEASEYTYKIYTILGIKFGSNQSSSDSSEIIPIEAGNDTTTRTFTFAKQPQFIKFYWGDPVISGGWATDAELVWGQAYMNYRSKPMGTTISQVDGGINSVAYGADGKSITFTAANAFGAMNTSNGSGYMYVDYGSSIVTTAYEDIAEGEWTSLLVHTPSAGGSWSAATAIPTNATHIAIMVNYRSTNYEPMILRLADLDKIAEATGNSQVKGGYQWQVGSDYDKVAYDYDSTNKTISVYAGYNGLSVNVFSIKADTPSQDRNAESRTDTIWSGSETTSAWVSPIILDDLPLDDYDMLSIQVNGTHQLVMVNQIPTGDSGGSINIGLGGFMRNDDAIATMQIFLNRTGNTLRIFTGTGNSANLTKIAGIKFANAKANPMCYAEVEREVGTWIDGKPLYQRTFNLSSTTFSDNAWTNNVLGKSGINIKKFEGYFGLVGYDSRFPLDYYRNSSEYFTSTTNDDCSDLNFRPNMNAGVGVRGDIVTIWYTKNSDVAGSGMYTSTGTPTVHYSTVEHVVGTWVDGKTLYERSYPNISITSTNNSIQTGISFDTLVDIEANGYKIDGSNNKIRFGASYNDGGDRLDVEGVNNDLRIICTNWFIGGVANITIRYTKSTT